MGEIKAFCLMACAISLLAVMIRAVAPERLQKPIGMIVNLFLLLCLLSPISRLPYQDFLREKNAEINEGIPAGLDTDALLHAEVIKRIERVIHENLEKNGIFPQEIRIDITVADHTVEIQAISIVLQPQDEQLCERAQEITKQLLQIEALVTATEEVK